MSNELSTIENVLINGDLATLKPNERVAYYNKVCESTGLNPLTQPFSYIKLNGKLTLYARKDCTDQLRAVQGISIEIKAREKIGDVYIVTATASKKDGRCDESTGAVNIKGLTGDALANAYMKAETKAKRRVTLSIAGLGLLDEHEVETIPNSSIKVDIETGEIIEGEVIRADSDAMKDVKELEDAVKILKDYISTGDRMGVVELMRSYEDNRPFIKKMLNLLNAEQKTLVVETMKNAPPKKVDERTKYATV